MIKSFCDICAKEIPNNVPVHIHLGINHNGIGLGYDLCDSCYKRFYSGFETFIEYLRETSSG